MGYERQLNSLRSIEHFLENCIPKGRTFQDADGKTISSENLAKKVETHEKLAQRENSGSTYAVPDDRSGIYRADNVREKLRGQIVEELFSLPRLADDEKILLGTGGARPSDVKTDHQAFLLTGLPASGKSSVVSTVCDAFGAYVVDPDYVKRKLPEFDNSEMGAAKVHDESMQVALGSKDPSGPNLLSLCIAAGANIVRPLIGDEKGKLEAFARILIGAGYAVHLCLVEIPREEAVCRALSRFLRTKRYISLPYIFDECANDPALVYYKYRADSTNGTVPWASMGALSTSGDSPVRIDSWGKGSPAELFEVPK
jgi:hypothetical protein